MMTKNRFRLIHNGADVTDKPISTIIPSDVDTQTITLEMQNTTAYTIVNIEFAANFPAHDISIPDRIKPYGKSNITFVLNREELMWNTPDNNNAHTIITAEYERHYGYQQQL